jgi:hypothetical protein
MTLAVLELNDQSLLIQAEGGPLHAEPGFACLTSDGIRTGEYARAISWSEPQHSYNQYWCHLNQAPMAAKQKFARHNADIAFAQLGRLWEDAGKPASMILLVPGSFDDGQLSLLLGLVGALPCETTAVVDSALAACLEASRETLYVDMQLHQTVMSVCRPAAGMLEIAAQEVFPDLGMMQILNSSARQISRMLIDSARYDPLHASDSEQAIYDLLPEWLARLRWESEVSSSLQTQKGELPFILRKEQVTALIGERLANVRSFLARNRGSRLLLSYPSALLADLADEFDGAEVASHGAAVENAFAAQSELAGGPDGLYRVRSLARETAEAESRQPRELLATHVLHGDTALSLRRPVSFHLENGLLRADSGLDRNAALTVVLREQGLEAVHRANGADIALPRSCTPGQSIVVEGHELRLIEVRHED